MIVPSKRLIQFVEVYGSRDTLCEKLGIQESVLSELLNRKRGASARTLEKFFQFTAIPL